MLWQIWMFSCSIILEEPLMKIYSNSISTYTIGWFSLQESGFYYLDWECFQKNWKKNHKKNYKPDSVLRRSERLLFICVVHCCTTFAGYPSVFGASNSYSDCSENPIYLPLHRKEFTWFHYKLIYILSVALVLILRPTDVIRFAALWCPDFPTSPKRNQQTVFLVDCKDTLLVGRWNIE